MKWAMWMTIIALGLIAGGWMTCDGLRRLLVGDYVRIDGKLGPWQHVFALFGIDPMGWPVAMGFVVIGIARLGAIGGLAVHWRHGWHAVLLTAILAAWYLPAGTLASLLTLVLLGWPGMKQFCS